MTTRNLTPQQGSVDSFVSRLVEYVSSHDSAYPTKIKGASQKQIERYCELSGIRPDEPPSTYLSYLETLGVEDGDLLGWRRIDPKIERLIRVYEDWSTSEPESLSSTVPVIGTYLVGDQVSLDLRSPTPNPPVVETSDAEIVVELSVSFEHYMMQASMMYVESARHPHRIWASSSQATVENHLSANGGTDPSTNKVLQGLAQKFGLHTAWCSENNYKILINEKTSIFAETTPGTGLMTHVFTEADSNQLPAISDELENMFGATPHPLERVDEKLPGT